MATPLDDLSRLCVHTATTKPWPLARALEHYAAAGVHGITVWRDVLAGPGLAGAARLLSESGLDVVSLCRGGFFPADDEGGLRRAIADNLLAIDEAAAIGAPLIVLVCGARPGLPLPVAREQIRAGIEAILPRAAEAGIRLAIEPLHPMYADDRSAINTLAQANDMAEAIGHPLVGVAVDVYHLWWDPALEAEIERCGRAGRLFAYHVCDWRTPTRHMLTDRGLMGEGCIPLRQIRGWVERAGFKGFVEVEIFSEQYWAMDQAAWLERVVEAWRAHA